MKCPHCGVEFEVPKGGLSLPSDSDDEKAELKDKEIKTPKSPPKSIRGKAREYSIFFEQCWKAYGRKEQKFEAYGVWLLRAKELGAEPLLMDLVLKALKWQAPIWAGDGWKYALYFERYLKRRKWEDEPLPVPTARPAARAPRETFQAARDREATEARERTARELERQVAQTEERLTLCAAHLYGPREDRQCNRRCPAWEGKVADGRAG